MSQVIDDAGDENAGFANSSGAVRAYVDRATGILADISEGDQ
jgi:hypothetical protein